ncbi:MULTISPECIES: hypothetical protein [unclassified Lysobacter]|uniref:hypothetical protein n=1 Tax=unclassified Lysobacter TaxID=2635362 RepID=UPI001BE701E0|nr:MULTISPECIES: hypothetical protein [unclassified Lysobacter]MBT2744900.1 hypothetical protein [Lysobacter sp. ISL-42]MBT2752107.1 hypothetical protein [Lysobacter sp. ISL-50]MBT2778604.1 hypothetical protein [Lysobacter sp. ISL-54]MBT2780465.1 hypothetical protein [Lysobacter sp. ISL-52]
MLGISPFGLFHTAISLIALAAGVVAFWRYREIAMSTMAGRLFVWLTVGSCITGLFIFRHGGFGKPHALAVITLVVLALAAFAERKAPFGRISPYIATVAYSLTFFFHFIPGFTETLTRVPVGQPWASGPDDPRLAMLIGAAFVVFLMGVVFQVLRMRTRSRVAGTVATGNPG